MAQDTPLDWLTPGGYIDHGHAKLKRRTVSMTNPFSPDYSKRDYLLPNGCKDLIDLLRVPEPNDKELPWPAPPLIGEITIPVPVTVKELARLLHQKPFKIVADLMQIGVFGTVDWALPLDAAAKIARRYGYRLMREA